MVLSLEQLMKSVSLSSLTLLTKDLCEKWVFSSWIATSSILKYEPDVVILEVADAGKFLKLMEPVEAN